VEDRIKKIMSDILNIDMGLISAKSSPDNIENWDSLKHMNLIVALEEEFEVEFTDEEIIDSMDYTLILNILKSK
jgi:acyl carrier protein